MKKFFMFILFSSFLSFGAAASMVVYKSPFCGCCVEWINHMEMNGFTVKAIDTHQMGKVHQDLGIRANLASCHTALIDGYIIEGHVPAELVHELLETKPNILGLTIPGMPQSAPGMDIPGEPYQVLSFDAKGEVKVVKKYPG